MELGKTDYKADALNLFSGAWMFYGMLQKKMFL